MSQFLIGLFIVLHGLVHLWYFVLARRLVEFRPEMGWTGKSWILTNILGDTATTTLASVVFLLAAVGFVVGGIAIITYQVWWRPLIIGTSVFATVITILYWDGIMRQLPEKGLIGLLIDVGILAILFARIWPRDLS